MTYEEITLEINRACEKYLGNDMSPGNHEWHELHLAHFKCDRCGNEIMAFVVPGNLKCYPQPRDFCSEMNPKVHSMALLIRYLAQPGGAEKIDSYFDGISPSSMLCVSAFKIAQMILVFNGMWKDEWNQGGINPTIG